MTRLVGVIGHPLGHSISPAFQQAALDHLGLDIRYQAWDTPPGQVANLMLRLRGPEHLGASVTVPYKEVALGLVDDLDGLARRIGAINTLVNREGKLIGYNTDAGGFLRALKEEGGFQPRGRRAVVLGAGGAARAVAFALAGEGAASIAIINRTRERALALAEELRPVEAQALAPQDPGVARALGGCHLVVNCTSVGMRHSSTEGESPLKAELIPPQALVYDLVYNPPLTPLLRAAQGRGARTLGGLAMLVYQGAEAFQLWTGREAPLEVMMRAAREALERVA